ncbi:MAG TPA: (4Fe-4S)-binding protein [Armatimonadota bacterium]|nr:(4Fe-4S)-binding protein [Armatimonadota bacterium]
MNMLTSAMVKKTAIEFGADLVGIADIDRFTGVPKENDPHYIAPNAKVVIGLGFRILRGSLRGIEEGTHFYQYPEMGVVNIDERFAPMVLRRLGCFLEDHGYEGVVQRTIPDRRPASDPGTNPEHPSVHKLASATPVEPDKPAPDVLINFQHAAYLCGLGEIGDGGFFLTPEFGPLQRFAFILTDAPLEADPIYNGPSICDHCSECISGCPGQAISPTETVATTLADKTIRHAKLNEWQCAAYYAGAYAAKNPFLANDVLNKFPDGEKIARGEKQLSADEVKQLLPILNGAYYGVSIGYNACLCGRACYRACLMHLEQSNTLTKKFHSPFRTKPDWELGG